MIVIYERDAVDFSTNGLGTLAPQSCLAEETMNGGYEVTLVHPLDEAGKYKKIQKERILRVPVPAANTPRIHVGASATASRDIYKVVTDGRRLNIRAAPDNGKIIGSYKPGTEVVVIDRESNDSWSEVTGPDGKHGWMWTGNLEYVRTEATGTEAEESIKEAAALRDQPFRIYKVVPTLTEITVYARHIFYDLMDNMVSAYTPTAGMTGAQAVAGLSDATEEQHGFTFYSDIDTTAEDVEIRDKNPAEAILDDGGLIEAYGGELMRDWWDVYLAKRVGSETGLQIREGKNLLGISYSEDMTNVVTRIIPRGEDKDGNKLYLPERYIENTAEDRPVYAHHKWHVLDVKEAKEKTSGDEKRTPDDCYRLMREAAAKAFEEGCDYPDITLDVNFIDCTATEEYRQYRQLQSIHMGDMVRVWTKRSRISAALRMTHYIYNCLTKQYEKMTLGTADATIEGNMINPRSIGSGTIKGSMLARGSVGAGAIQDGAVNSLKIALAAIDYAHMGTAVIKQLAADAITAIRADIRELVAGNITTDQLYADLAQIAVAQITTASIKNAQIDWAQIATLTAQMAAIAEAEIGKAVIDAAQINNLSAVVAELTKAEIGKATIGAAQIEDLDAEVARIVKADIDWATIDSLTAVIASIANAELGTADIDYARIKDLVTGTAIITEGVGGKLYISRLAVTEANMVSLTVGTLMLKATDGNFVQLVADGSGGVTTRTVQVVGDNVADATLPGRTLIENTITARELNVEAIFADTALIRAIKAANIDVADLFAANATINELDNYILRTTTIEALKGSLDVWASDKIRLAVDGIQVGGRNLLERTNQGTNNWGWSMQTGGAAIETVEENGVKCVKMTRDSTAHSGWSVIRFWESTSGNLQAKMEEGVEYTLSVEIKPGADAVFGLQGIKHSDGTNVLAATVGAQNTQISAGKWNRCEWLLKAADDFSALAQTELQTVYFTPGDSSPGMTYMLRNLKLERGNKATGWTPAPEDTEAEIAKVRSEMTAEFKIQRDLISAKVSQTDFDELNKVVSEQGTTIVQTATKVESKAEKSAVDALGNRVAAAESSISQTPEQIRMAVENIQVGGRNLLPEANYIRKVAIGENSRSGYGFSTAHIAMPSTAPGEFGSVDGLSLAPGEEYTLSFTAWISDERANGSSVQGFNVDLYPDTLPEIIYDWQHGATVEPKRFIWTFVSDQEDMRKCKLRFFGDRSNADGYRFVYKIYVTDIQLERGNRATDWTPAPEDTDAAIAEVRTELTVSLEMQQGSITANATAVETVRKSAATAQSTANQAQSAANSAQSTADGAQSAADNAQSTANQAQSAANNAQSTANDAQGAAASAQSAANNAQSTANAAQNAASANTAALTDVSKRVTTVQAEVDAVEGVVALKAEKTELNALGDTVAANKASIEARADEISLEVSGIRVGGRNLIKNTNTGLGTWGMTRDNNDYSLAEEEMLGVRGTVIGINSVSPQWSVIAGGYQNILLDQLRPDTDYTVSFDAYSSADIPEARISIRRTDSSYEMTGNVQTPVIAAGRWQRVAVVLHTYATLPAIADQCLYWGNINTPCTLRLCNLKLEEGNRATAWSPAPEDPASALADGSSFVMNKDMIRATTKSFEVAAVGADGVTTQMRITEEGAEFGDVRAPNIAYRYAGPAAITVNPNATGAQIASGGVYRSLQEALSALSGRYIPHSVTIDVQGDSYGAAELTGAYGRSVTVNGNGYSLFGRLEVFDDSLRAYINNLRIISDGSGWAARFVGNGWYMASGCTISGGGAENCLMIYDGARARLADCGLYNAAGLLYIGQACDVSASNLSGGNCTNFAAAYGSTVKFSGTRPDGGFASHNASIVMPSDPTTLPIDYGTATPTIPEITTASWPMLYADTYAGGYENSWNYQGHDDIVQGYTEHGGRIFGCIWFDNAAIRSAVSGKTVNQASLRLTAQKYVGRGVAVEVHLWGTATEYAARNGAPALTVDYGVIGTATPGETATITIPAQAAADLASGAINGLMLYSDDTGLYSDKNYSKNYMKFDGMTSGDGNTRPVLTVVYQ